jgi:hexulose-6-phosphate isomerase
MKTAINQWAFPAEMSTVDAISLAAEIGFEAFEICVAEENTLLLNSSEADIASVKTHADALGIGLHTVGNGMGWQYPLSSPDADIREKGKEIIARSLRIAAQLGAHTVLVVPGNVLPDVSYDDALERALAGIQDLVPVAEECKVNIGIENVWNRLLLSPTETRDFIDQCESDYVGAYFDVGNIIKYGFPEQWIRILGSRVRAIHMKDFRESTGNMDGFVMLMEGSVNWPEVMAALRDIGYDGPLTAEYGPYAHSLEAMLNHVLTSTQTIMAL